MKKVAYLIISVMFISCHNENSIIRIRTNIPWGYRDYHNKDTSRFYGDLFLIDSSQCIFIGVSAPNDKYLISYTKDKNDSIWNRKVLDTNVHFEPYLLRSFSINDLAYLYYRDRQSNNYYIYVYEKKTDSIIKKLVLEKELSRYVYWLSGHSKDYIYLADYNPTNNTTTLMAFNNHLDASYFSFSINEEVRGLYTYNDSTYLLITLDKLISYNRYSQKKSILPIKQDKIYWILYSALKTDFCNNCIYITFYCNKSETSYCYRYKDGLLQEICTFKRWQIIDNIQVSKKYLLFFMEKNWPYAYKEKVVYSDDYGKTFKEKSLFRQNLSSDANIALMDDSIFYFNRYDYYELVKDVLN